MHEYNVNIVYENIVPNDLHGEIFAFSMIYIYTDMYVASFAHCYHRIQSILCGKLQHKHKIRCKRSNKRRKMKNVNTMNEKKTALYIAND